MRFILLPSTQCSPCKFYSQRSDHEGRNINLKRNSSVILLGFSSTIKQKLSDSNIKLKHERIPGGTPMLAQPWHNIGLIGFRYWTQYSGANRSNVKLNEFFILCQGQSGLTAIIISILEYKFLQLNKNISNQYNAMISNIGSQ